ncbi:MAG: hypothetical protein LBV78_20430, partial [Kitasatospora sp.]|nr:hypothetical protein [Kitasatospora sp.]
MKSRSLLDLTPRIRPELRIGRPLRRGAAEVHLIRDPDGGRQLEVGPKEHFVITRLDGTRTLAEVGEQYAAHFRARLGEPQWQQLLGLLYARGLIEGVPRPAPAATAKQTAEQNAERHAGQNAEQHAERYAKEPARQGSSGLLAGRVRMVADAPALLERLHRATGFARRPAFLVPLLALVVALLVAVAAEFGTLADETATLARNPVALLAVGVLLWFSLALHELAHGLVAHAFGGRVGEIGLRWRLPVTYLYCEVEDVRFFPRRRQQVATAAAGPSPTWSSCCRSGPPGCCCPNTPRPAPSWARCCCSAPPSRSATSSRCRRWTATRRSATPWTPSNWPPGAAGSPSCWPAPRSAATVPAPTCSATRPGSGWPTAATRSAAPPSPPPPRPSPACCWRTGTARGPAPCPRRRWRPCCCSGPSAGPTADGAARAADRAHEPPRPGT